MDTAQIIGRSSSHFTRVARIFAEELGVPHEVVPIYDMTEVDPGIYAGNPALKLPSLRRGGSLVFGAENICRALFDMAGAKKRVVWPEELCRDISRNAQEMVWHGMAAEVQLIFGTMVAKLPAENLYFVKAKAGFEGALGWLDRNVEAALGELPSPRDVSLFEVTLFCLMEHIVLRKTLDVEPYAALEAFRRQFGQKESAQRTAYRFDVKPA